MKETKVPLFDLSRRAASEMKKATRGGYVILTVGGKPIAYVLPTEFYDEEDIGYMTDPAFWRMVRQWREQKGPGIPFEQVKAELAAAARLERKSVKSSKNGKNGRKGKRNASA
jgi:hypothetical protein